MSTTTSGKKVKQIFEITLRTAHDVRKFRPCARCDGLGMFGEMIPVAGEHYHRICFKRRFGLAAVLRLPREQSNMFQLNELGVKGMKALVNKGRP